MHRRWNEHRSRLRRGLHWLPYLQNCWTKYGEDAFAFEVLEGCEPDRMTAREQWWIDHLAPVFNVAPRAGSLAGYKRPFRPLTPEHRAKISAAHKGKVVSAEHRARLRAAAERRKLSHPPKPEPPRRPLKGVPLSPEHRAKISAALVGRKGATAGRKLTPEHRAKIAAAKIGKPPSEAARANMRAAQQRRRDRARAAQQSLDLAA